MKPFEAKKLAELIRDKMLTRKPAARLRKEEVVPILERRMSAIVDQWLARETSGEPRKPL